MQIGPVEPVPLTASSQRSSPLSFNFATDPVELRLTVEQTEILVEASQHHRQLLLLILPLPMPMLVQFHDILYTLSLEILYTSARA